MKIKCVTFYNLKNFQEKIRWKETVPDIRKNTYKYAIKNK